MAPKSERLRWINSPICWNCPEVFTTVNVACGQSSNKIGEFIIYSLINCQAQKRKVDDDGSPNL